MNNRTVFELRKWLQQFDPDDIVWGYEGEIQGIVVQSNDSQYTFHNDIGDNPYLPPSAIIYPQEKIPRNDDIK
jgi:hypothetical protein